MVNLGEWLEDYGPLLGVVLAGVLAIAGSITGVVIGQRMGVSKEREQWFRQERLRVCGELLRSSQAAAVGTVGSNWDEAEAEMLRATGAHHELMLLAPTEAKLREALLKDARRVDDEWNDILNDHFQGQLDPAQEDALKEQVMVPFWAESRKFTEGCRELFGQEAVEVTTVADEFKSSHSWTVAALAVLLLVYGVALVAATRIVWAD